MDPYSSGENSTIKTRKPYTITKQRERWTEDEHNSFLEALKLYGRAWQRIEEHIGTKTAVQIRSHAQKFFTKLEKEALAKGVPIRQALDIEIPPPRPKRKPSNPYPRKTGLKTHSPVAAKDEKQENLVSSSHSGEHLLDLEKQPLPEKTGGDGKPETEKTNGELEICTESYPLSEEAPSGSMSSGKVVNPCSFREFIPPSEKVVNHDETNESYITVENKERQKLGKDGIKHTDTTSNTSIFGHSHSHENLVQSQHADKLNQPGNCEGSQNCPRHVPVHIIDGTLGMSAKHNVPQEESKLNQMGEVHESPNVFVHAAASSCNQTVPAFHPLFMPSPDNQEDCRSLFHISSTISSLIVSSLLQNPAAHAAASLAATYWHSANDSSTSTAPSVTAIAAATVAAATAWWASHGLLPVCAPFPSPFAPPVDSNQSRPAEKSPPGDENMDSQVLKEHPPSPSSAEDSDGPTAAHTQEAPPVDELHDSSQPKPRKQVDRSSCGSNSTSSCELETDALEKQGKDKDGTKESDANLLPCDDSVFRRNRSSFSPNESWKEVSEEGRLAFQALFSRQVLPQSFSPPYDMDQQKLTMNTEGASSQLDLNSRSWVTCSSQEAGEGSAYAHLRREKHGEEGLLTMGLGNVKLKVHHTGFKPYKRCSVEAKESTMGSTGCQNDEKCPKRMRCQGEA